MGMGMGMGMGVGVGVGVGMGVLHPRMPTLAVRSWAWAWAWACDLSREVVDIARPEEKAVDTVLHQVGDPARRRADRRHLRRHRLEHDET